MCVCLYAMLLNAFNFLGLIPHDLELFLVVSVELFRGGKGERGGGVVCWCRRRSIDAPKVTLRPRMF